MNATVYRRDDTPIPFDFLAIAPSFHSPAPTMLARLALLLAVLATMLAAAPPPPAIRRASIGEHLVGRQVASAD